MAGVHLIDRDFTPTLTSVSGVETEVYRYVVPGGTLGTSNALRLEMIGALAATPVAFGQLRVIYGDTVLYSGGLTVAVDEGTERIAHCAMFLAAAGSEVQQASLVYFQTPEPEGINTVSGTDSRSDISRSAAVQRWCAEDSSNARPLFVTLQSQSPDMTLRALSTTLELLQPGNDSIALLNVDTTQNIVNATALTEAYRYTVPGGTLGSSNVLRLQMLGSRSATAASHWMELQATYGGVVVFSGGDAANTNTADQMWSLDLQLMGRASSAQQISRGRVLFGQLTHLSASGEAGDAYVNTTGDRWALHRWLAVDSAQDQDIAVYLRSSVDTQDLRVHGVYLEHLQPGTGGNRLLDTATPELLVSGTALTTAYAFTVPGGTLSNANALRFQLFGSQLSTPSNNRLEIRALYGGVTLFSGGRAFGLPAGTDRGWAFTMMLMPANESTQEQVAIGFATPMGSSSPSTSGQAQVPSNLMTAGHRWVNVDTTQDQPFLITIQNQTFDVFTRVHTAYVELLQDAAAVASTNYEHRRRTFRWRYRHAQP